MILITNDLFDIAWRLRAVNDDYRVYYNVEKGRFEVHNAKKNTLDFVVPYDELDARTVEYALYTRVENSKRIFEELERHNRLVEKEKAGLVVERAAAAYEEGRRLNEG